jgi:Tfp pilus assembly protein PilO
VNIGRRAPLVAAGVGAVVTLLLVFGLVLPKAHQVSKKKAEVDTAKQQQSQLQVQLAQLRAEEEAAPETRRRLNELQAEVPPTADLPGIIRLLNTTADESAVEFMSVTPQQPTPSPDGQLSIVPIQITVVGGFFSVDQFLSRLETGSRAATVVSISVGPGPQGLPQLQAIVSAQFYTTDTSAGPGSSPGPSGGTVGGVTPTPTSSPPPVITTSQPPFNTPSGSTSPSVSPSPSSTSSPSPSGGG